MILGFVATRIIGVFRAVIDSLEVIDRDGAITSFVQLFEGFINESQAVLVHWRLKVGYGISKLARIDGSDSEGLTVFKEEANSRNHRLVFASNSKILGFRTGFLVPAYPAPVLLVPEQWSPGGVLENLQKLTYS